MKKYKYLFSALFAVVYAFLISLGTECLFRALGAVTATAMGGYFPYLYWFSFILGILCAAALVATLIFNYNVSDKLGYNKYLWWLQSIAAAVLAFFMVEPWERLFVFLQENL